MCRKIRAVGPLLLLLAIGCAGCEQSGIEAEEFLAQEQAIINGVRVKDRELLSTVALMYPRDNSYCTGTLITPNYVLTAAHCVQSCEGKQESDVSSYVMRAEVGVGQSETKMLAVFDIESVHPHPQFVCNDWEILNDIAIVKLKQPVPLSTAVPTPPMPPHLDIRADELKGKSLKLLTSGFGLTQAYNPLSSGKKYKAEVSLSGVCPKERSKSLGCSGALTSFMFFNQQKSSTCQGDSGGPTFFTREGREYVVGVTSYGERGCQGISVSTLVSDYYPFIEGLVHDLAADGEEICDNGKDDNEDTRVDCFDPHCYHLKACIPEDCRNGQDDNDNGLIDCAEASCKVQRACQPEICDNGQDDNDDSVVDCAEESCRQALVCQPEICDNGKDDNGNGLIDCAEQACQAQRLCQPEHCSNGRDDNGNGLVDCDESSCKEEAICGQENCSNQIDDNGDGRVDCADRQCKAEPFCQPEFCNNGRDDNGNGLIDCAEASCKLSLYCQAEICDNGRDDNGNGRQDCDDRACQEDALCLKTPVQQGSGSCSLSSFRQRGGQASNLYFLAALLGGLAFLRRDARQRRRRKSVD